MAEREQPVRVEASLFEGCLVEHYYYSPGRYGPIAAHAHGEWQIGLNPDRPSRYLWRGSLHYAPVDQVSLFAPDERHASLGEDMGGPTRYYMLYLAETRRPARHLKAVSIGGATFFRRLRSFHRLAREPALPFEREVQLALVLGHLDDRPGDDPRPGRRLNRVRDYLRDHIATPVRLTDLSRLAGCTPEHLCRMFTRSFGLPPHAYLLQLRLRRAKELLVAGLKPESVAADLGFYDYSHFARRFLRGVGVSPACYGRIKNVQDSAPRSAQNGAERRFGAGP